ncbi:MAG: hypothetical protein HW421_2489 [Ignavibacteria bacterium]|nr:hypothetical protein [Ignavibacteria bacterium]
MAKKTNKTQQTKTSKPVVRQVGKGASQPEQSSRRKSSIKAMREKIWTSQMIMEISIYSIIIILTGYLFYQRANDFNLVYCDDNIFVIDYQRENADPENSFKIWEEKFWTKDNHIWTAFKRTIGTSYYRPILAISFMADYKMGQDKPWVYHRTNVILHVIGSLLVFIFLFKLGYPRLVSFIFGMLFVLHPVLTPAACWISGRNDSLITVFILLCFISMISFYENKRPWVAGLFLILNFLAFALSLYTKEIAAMIAFVALFYVIFFRKEKIFAVKNFILAGGWFFIGLYWWGMRTKALTGIKNPDTIGFDALYKNFATVPAMIGKIFLPVKMIALSNFEVFSIVTGIIIFLALAAYIIFSKRCSRRKTLFGIMWFVIFLFPTLMVRIVYVDDFFDYAEHRAYLAMVGMFLVVIEILISYGIKFEWKKPLPIIVSFALIIVFFFRANAYVPSFEDRKTFWSHMTYMYPYKSRGYLDLGKAYYVEGKLDTAEMLYFKGIERNPDNFNLYIDLSAIYMRQNKFKKAEEYARYAVKLDPENHIANYNLGKSLLAMDKVVESIEPFEKAAIRNNKYPHWFIDMGVAYFRNNQFDKAVNAYQRALMLDPNFLIGYTNLGAAYARMNDPKNAKIAWNNALSLDPKMYEIYHHIIRACIFEKNYDEAKQVTARLRANGGQLPPDIIQQLSQLKLKF